MERRILGIMVTLVVVAAVVVGFVMVAAGGTWRSAGGFTDLFDDLVYIGNATTNQVLSLPPSWEAGDVKVVSDRIVDMYYYRVALGQTYVYFTTLHFVYLGDQWGHPELNTGQSFTVPITDDTYPYDWQLDIVNGHFRIVVSSATNLADNYGVNDVITMKITLALNGEGKLAFDEWSVKGVV